MCITYAMRSHIAFCKAKKVGRNIEYSRQKDYLILKFRKLNLMGYKVLRS